MTDDLAGLTQSEAYWDARHPDHRETVDRVASMLAEGKPATDEAGNSTAFTDSLEKATAAPDSPEKYDFTHLRIEAGQEWNEALEAEARGWLHDLGASEQEARIYSKRYQEIAQLDHAARERLMVASEQTLRRVWGDQFDANVEAVESVIDRLGEGFRSFLMESGLNNDLGTITALLRKAR